MTGDPDVDALVLRFAVLEGGEVLEVAPTAAVVLLVRDGEETRLHLPRAVLAEGLREMGREGGHPFADDLAPGEALARLLSLHLHESLDTRAPDGSGWWSYADGGFDPEPPWEAHRKRRW